jgi:hypothetical protein
VCEFNLRGDVNMTYGMSPPIIIDREKNPRAWVTAKELGEKWSLSPRSIAAYRKKGIFDGLAVKTPAGWRYHSEAIELLFLEMDRPNKSLSQEVSEV